MPGIRYPAPELIESQCLFNDAFRHYSVIIRNAEYIMEEVPFSKPSDDAAVTRAGTSGRLRQRPTANLDSFPYRHPCILGFWNARGEIQRSS